eukprot:SAG22_NODE_729_length_7596_cov_20.310924_3_plen_109_part_00
MQHEVMNQNEVTVGVYCDDQLSDTLIWNNTFVEVQMGIQLGGGRNHTVRNNSFIRCGVAVEMDARGTSQAGNELCRPGGTFQQVRDFMTLCSQPALSRTSPHRSLLLH